MEKKYRNRLLLLSCLSRSYINIRKMRRTKKCDEDLVRSPAAPLSACPSASPAQHYEVCFSHDSFSLSWDLFQSIFFPNNCRIFNTFVWELTCVVCVCVCVCVRGECTESLRRRISELETECKKLTLDIKVKEDQIRELELKVQVRRCSCVMLA